MLLEDVPQLLLLHLRNVRKARAQAAGGTESIAACFKMIDSHPALKGHTYFRRLAETILSVQLPIKDFKSRLLRGTACDILIFTVIKPTLQTISEPHIVMELLAKVSVCFSRWFPL